MMPARFHLQFSNRFLFALAAARSNASALSPTRPLARLQVDYKKSRTKTFLVDLKVHGKCFCSNVQRAFCTYLVCVRERPVQLCA